MSSALIFPIVITNRSAVRGTEIVQIKRGWPFGEDVALGQVVARLVVESDANALQEEIGIEPLPARRERHAAPAELR
jgi:hypothetical protein